MPTVEKNLFNLGAATPDGGIAHGGALIRGDVNAGAVFRRGIDLSAGIHFEGRLGGDLGKVVVGSLDAKAEAGAGVALTVALPLDLFDEAGLVARFRAQAAAAASVRASLDLEFEVFRGLIREHFDPPVEGLLEIFLDEVRIGAGVWGRAAFSAEIYAQAALAGSLLETPEHEAGFTFTAEYGVGWGGGAGFEFAANFGFEDPQRMMGRLADATSAAMLAEAEGFLRGQPPSTASAVAPALAALRIVLPLAADSAFRLGLELTTAEDGNAREQAARAVAESFVARAQQQVLEAVLEFAVGKLGELMREEGLPDPADLLNDAGLTGLVDALIALRDDVLTELTAATPADPDRWLLAVLDVLEAVETVLDFGTLPQQVEDEVRHGAGMLWAAGTLAHRVVSFARDSTPGTLFGSALAPVTTATRTTAEIANAIGKPPGAGLTLADLVTFLVGADPLTEVRSAVPWAGDVLDWIEQATGSSANQLLEHLLVDLAQPDETVVEELLTFLGGTLGDVVAQQVVPDLLDPIKASDPANEGLALFIDELVTPLLVSLPVVVLPNLPQVDTEEGRLRLREALSAVLLQLVGQFVLAAGDVLLHHGLDDAEQVLRDTGRSVRQAGAKDPAYAAVAAVAAGAILPLTPTPAEIDQLLNICADVVALVDDEEREPVVEAAKTVLAVGLGAEATRKASLQALTGSSDAPREADLEVLLERIEDGAWDAMGEVAPKLLALIAGHFEAQAVMIAEAIEEGAREIVAAAEAALEWFGQQLAALEAELNRLIAQAEQLLAAMLADVRALTAHLSTLASGIVDDVRDAAFSLIESLIGDFPQWAQDALRGLLGDLFDAVDWIVTLPAEVLGSVAAWVEEILTSDLASAALDEVSIRDTVRQRILGSQSGDLQFCLSLEAFGQKIFDIGCIDVPGASILGAVADAVGSDPIFSETVRGASADAVELRGLEVQKSALQGQIDGSLDDATASAAAEDLTPGLPLAVSFVSPEPFGLTAGEAQLEVRVEGANRTFVESVLDVPRRLRLKFNGREYVFTPEHWQETADGGLLLDVRVALPSAPAAGPQVAPLRFTAAAMRRETPVSVRLAAGEAAVFAERAPVRSSPVSASLSVAATRSGAGIRSEDHQEVEVLDALPVSAVMAPSRVLAARVEARSIGGGEQEPTAVRGRGSAHVSFNGGAPLARAAASPTGSFELIAPEPAAEIAPTDGQGRPLLPGQIGLNAVQVAVSDGKGRQASNSLVFFLAEKAPPEVSKTVSIQGVEFNPPGRDWEGEHVVIGSSGSSPVDLEGWILRDLAHHVYRFPAFTLPPGATVKVWTGPGADDAENLHWGRRSAIWNNDGDSAVLVDADGREIARHTYLGRR